MSKANKRRDVNARKKAKQIKRETRAARYLIEHGATTLGKVGLVPWKVHTKSVVLNETWMASLK
jgi:hypothetical protein